VTTKRQQKGTRFYWARQKCQKKRQALFTVQNILAHFPLPSHKLKESKFMDGGSSPFFFFFLRISSYWFQLTMSLTSLF